MKKIKSEELKNTLTLITTFMYLEKSKELKTFEELLNIFEKCYKKWSDKDVSNDLRILDFQKAMEEKNWHSPIILIKDTRLNFIVDGIHRGIAYLRCIQSGIDENELPEVYIINNSVGFL